jgi:hypothetical protein
MVQTASTAALGDGLGVVLGFVLAEGLAPEGEGELDESGGSGVSAGMEISGLDEPDDEPVLCFGLVTGAGAQAARRSVRYRTRIHTTARIRVFIS